MVVEAKKAEAILLDTARTGYPSYKLQGPALKVAQSELGQTRRYALSHNVAYAVLTSGLQWIGFLAYRTDGSNSGSHHALVFPSLASIRDSFAAFYDLFSKEGVRAKLLDVYIQEVEGTPIRHAEVLEPAIPDSKVYMLRRSDLAQDLDRIFSAFFSEMSGCTIAAVRKRNPLATSSMISQRPRECPAESP